MTRRAFLGLPTVGAFLPVLGETAISLASGLVTATDTERAEGMAAIGQGCAVYVKADTVYAQRLAELAGKQVELVARVIG